MMVSNILYGLAIVCLFVALLGDHADRWRRAGLALLVPPLAIDCAVNGCCGGKFTQTLSARAATNWPRVACAIDKLFFWQPHHCLTQWRWEYSNGGSVWRAWLAEWRAA